MSANDPTLFGTPTSASRWDSSRGRATVSRATGEKPFQSSPPQLANRWLRSVRLATECETLQQPGSAWGHVYEPAVMTLEGHRHRGGRPVQMFGHYHVSLPGPGRLTFVGVLAMQKNNDVAILFNTIVQANSICHKIVSS